MLEPLLEADRWLRAWVVAHRWTPFDTVMLALSIGGRLAAVWLVLTAIGWYRDRSRAPAFWQAVTAIVLAFVLADLVLKPVVHRPRPFAVVSGASVIGSEPGEYSFPSGHAATCFAGAWALARAWPAAGPALWVLALLISYSRVYVGVHYPLDVIAGALIGIGAAYLAIGRTRWRGEPPVVR